MSQYRRRYRRRGRQLNGYALHLRLYPIQKLLIPLFGVLAAGFFIGSFFVNQAAVLWVIAGLLGAMTLILAMQCWRTYRFLNTFKTIRQLRGMNPFAFEDYVVALLRKHGYPAKGTPRNRDFGADFTMKHRGVFSIGQCKRYHAGHKVSSPEMQTFLGSMQHHRAKKGIFVTTSTFTSDAQLIAKQNNIQLIDETELCKLIQKAHKRSAADPDSSPETVPSNPQSDTGDSAFSADIIERAYSQGWINDWERDFSLDTINRSSLTDKQLAKKEQITQKIIRHT